MRFEFNQNGFSFQNEFLTTARHHDVLKILACVVLDLILNSKRENDSINVSHWLRLSNFEFERVMETLDENEWGTFKRTVIARIRTETGTKTNLVKD